MAIKKTYTTKISLWNESGMTSFNIEENKLIISESFATSYDFIEPLFPGDDREKKVTSSRTIKKEFILPENKKIDLFIMSDVIIKYEFINGEKHLIDFIEDY